MHIMVMNKSDLVSTVVANVHTQNLRVLISIYDIKDFFLFNYSLSKGRSREEASEAV